jgi:hypothetical protein
MGKKEEKDIHSMLIQVEAQGSEMFRQMQDALLKAEPNLEGAFAIIYAVSMTTACLKKAFSLSGAVMNCHFDQIVKEWDEPLENDLYGRLEPFDEYVFKLLDSKKV